jgi:hypothetical protein
MMNAERQLASSMNPQTQRALNRDQALIYGNNAAYSEFGDVVSQSMSTDVDPYAEQNEMDGLLAPVARSEMEAVPENNATRSSHRGMFAEQARIADSLLEDDSALSKFREGDDYKAAIAKTEHADKSQNMMVSKLREAGYDVADDISADQARELMAGQRIVGESVSSSEGSGTSMHPRGIGLGIPTPSQVAAGLESQYLNISGGIDDWQSSVSASYQLAQDNADSAFGYVSLGVLEATTGFAFGFVDLAQNVSSLVFSADARDGFSSGVISASESLAEFKKMTDETGFDFRMGFSIKSDFGEIKILGGSDFIGAQYKWGEKSKSGEETVTRVGWDYDEGFTNGQIVQKDVVLLSGKRFEVKTGVRGAITSTGGPSSRQSLDFSIKLPKIGSFEMKFGTELRSPNMNKYYEDDE